MKLFLGFILSLFLVSSINANNHQNGMNKYLDGNKSCKMKEQGNYKCSGKCEYKKEMKTHCNINEKAKKCNCKNGADCTCKGNCKCSKK